MKRNKLYINMHIYKQRFECTVGWSISFHTTYVFSNLNVIFVKYYRSEILSHPRWLACAVVHIAGKILYVHCVPGKFSQGCSKQVSPSVTRDHTYAAKRIPTLSHWSSRSTTYMPCHRPIQATNE